MWLLLQALDTQFYRDGRPFDAGTMSLWASSVFPPYPHTIYGGFRTAILARNSPHMNIRSITEDVKRVIGDQDNFGSLAIRGPILASCSADETAFGSFFPCPRDLLQVKGYNEFLLVAPQDKDGQLTKFSNLSEPGVLPCLPPIPDVLEECASMLFDKADMGSYLQGEAMKPKEADSLFRREERLGIGLNYVSRTASNRLLYNTAHVRMIEGDEMNGGLLVEVDDITHGGLLNRINELRLGGEGRVLRCREILGINWTGMREAVKKKILDKGRFKFYLVTPGLFSGWHPDFLKPSGAVLEGELPGSLLKVSLVGACVGRSIPIGGFDIVRGCPKKIERAVPAGSVYFLRFSDWDSWDQNTKELSTEQLVNNLFFRPLKAQDGEAWKEGFGTLLIGGW